MPVRNTPVYLPRFLEAEPENGSTPTFEQLKIPFNSIALSSDASLAWRRISHWLTAVVATRTMRVDAFAAGSSRIQSLSGKPGLQFQQGTGSLTVAVGGSLFHTEQYFLSLSSDVLAIINQSTHTVPANTSIWVYASGAPIDRIEQTGGQGTSFPGALPASVDLYFDDVGTGNPPTPPAGYYVVGGCTSDGLEVISNDAAPYIGIGLSIAQDTTFEAGTTIYGDSITLEHLVDSTAVSITSANNFAPAVFVIGAVGSTGTLIQAQGTVSTTAPALVASNPGAGIAAYFSKFSGAGNVLEVLGFGAGKAVNVVHSAAAQPAVDIAVLTAVNGVEIDTTTGAALVLAPQSDPVTTDEGSVWVNSATSRFSFRQPVTGNIKRVWSSDHGLDFDRNFVSASSSSVAAVPQILATVSNYPFKQFSRYTITAHANLSRTFGNPDGVGQMSIHVGGVAVPECNLRSFRLWTEQFPGLADNLWTIEIQYQHTDPTGAEDIELVLVATDKRYALRGLHITGHHQG